MPGMTRHAGSTAGWAGSWTRRPIPSTCSSRSRTSAGSAAEAGARRFGAAPRVAVTAAAYHPAVAWRVEWVPYGRAASDRLRLLISESKAGEPLTPVTVVVPSNHVGVATRRLLAGGALGPVCAKGSGIAAVTFLTPYRLAELLGAARLAG